MLQVPLQAPYILALTNCCLQGVADLQHAVHQYVNNTAIHVEGHACTADSHPTHEARTAESQEAPVVLRREEVVISAVQLMPVRTFS